MTAPNMATITASLQNCFLNHQHQTIPDGGATIESQGSPENRPDGDTTLELNSHMSLPYQWEQCLDLKTGEVYFINWRNGMRATEDPRTAASPEYSGGDYYYSDDDSSYDSEEESSSPLARDEHFNKSSDQQLRTDQKDNVLVVAGCKSCFMYFMVPKQVGDCPKCTGQLLHLDRSDDASS